VNPADPITSFPLPPPDPGSVAAIAAGVAVATTWTAADLTPVQISGEASDSSTRSSS
jgi:hypothetical protein